MIKEKVQVVVGDLNLPSLGLSDSDRAAVIKNVNVVIHCAASMDGKERLDTATMVSQRIRIYINIFWDKHTD